MGNVAVVGAQWGDEGKGKIVDWLSERADVVVRFQGGHNAGHTLVIGNVEYKLSLLPVGRRAARQAVDHRQRRRRRSLGADRRDRRDPRQGRRCQPGDSEACRQCRADPAVARRARPCPRGTAQRQARSARPAAASARLMRTRSGAGRSGSATSPTRRRSNGASTRCCCTTTRCCAGSTSPRSIAASCSPSCSEIAPRILPYAEPVWRLLDEARAQRPAHSVRGGAGCDARCRSRHLPLRHLFEHGRGAGGGRIGDRARRHRLCSRHHQGLHDAGRQRPVSDRAERRGRPDARRARPRVRRRHRTQAALRLVRRGRGAAGDQDRAASTASP